MSARTCLLCGKTLGRIWVGAGDDFCSREHGNQYRLKRGMDRLTEANKISSLMRRRENPRPITAAHLPLDSASARRDFPEARTPVAGRTRFASLGSLAAPFMPRVSTVSERYLPLRLPQLAGFCEPRLPDSAPPRFSGGKTAPVALERRAARPLGIPRAGAALLRGRVAGAGGEWRGFNALRLADIGAHAGLGGMAPSRIELPGAACFLSNRRPREIEAPPRTGNARKVSRSFGFCRPARRGAVCARLLKARVAAAPLALPARRFLRLRKTLNGPAAPRAMSRRISTGGFVYPSMTAGVSVAGLQWPGARMGKRPCNGDAPVVREWPPLWNVSGVAGFPNPRRSLSMPERSMPTSCVVALPLAPVRANGAPHVALAPFAPQNSPFGYKEYQEI